MVQVVFRRFGSGLAALVAGSLWLCPTPANAASITINGAQTNQVIDGFGANINSYPWNTNAVRSMIDAFVDEAGMTIFRVVLQNGWETSNDNTNPAVMNWNYYNALYSTPDFERLWEMMAYLNQKGITNGLMLNPQGIGPYWMGGDTLTAGMEEEWAEMVASLLIYARTNRHLGFTLLAPHNEPDYPPEGISIPTAAQYVTTLHKLAEKLDANGLGDVQFVGPDRAGGNTAFMPEMMNDPLVISKVAHFGVHSYGGAGTGSSGVRNFISQSAYPDRTLWVTEFNVWCDSCIGEHATNGWAYSRGTAEYLLDHLTVGVSAGLVWEGYDSYYPHDGFWTFFGLFSVNDTNAVPFTYTPQKNFYTMAQVAKFVRPGARRIGLSGSIPPFQLLAFYHPTLGQLAITGINDSGPASLTGTLTGLPTIPSLDLYVTGATTNLAKIATVPISNGTFTITIPTDCVFTLTGFDPTINPIAIVLTNPPSHSRFPAATNILIQVNATTTTGTVSGVEFYTNATKLAESTIAPYNLTWSNVPPGTYTLTARASNSLGQVGLSPGISIVAVGPLAQISVTPASWMILPYATQPFTALGSDAFGNALITQPDFTWSLDDGGTINTNGLFTSDGTAGGPFHILATSGSITGTTSLTISNNFNVAPLGNGYAWHTMTTTSQNSPLDPASGINDGNLDSDVTLNPNAVRDDSNSYEAGGVIWSTPQNINRVIYKNGSYTATLDGVFCSGFKLQFTTDGTNWNDSGWTNTPAYIYNSAASANVSYTFTDGATNILGFRCIGRVRTSETVSPNSWFALVREVQAFAVATLPPPTLLASLKTNNLILAWQSFATNYQLEATADLSPPQTWLAVTNAPQLAGDRLSVILSPLAGQQFFRLRKP